MSDQITQPGPSQTRQPRTRRICPDAEQRTRRDTQNAACGLCLRTS